MKYIYYSLAFIVIGAIISVSVWYATRPVPLTIQGEFHAKQVQVAAKVPGNVQSLSIIEGQHVKKGEVLAKLDSPTLRAKELQALAAVKAAADIVADYDVEVCSGFQFAGIGDLAAENPATNFILVDSYPTDSTGATVELDNVYAMQFAEQESGFFAGIAAALETETGKVAVVNGVAFPSNVNYQYGFECGVKYVNEKFGKNVECVELASRAGTDVTGVNVGGNYIGSFADPSTGRIVGQQLIEAGCDIIFVAAGDSGNGVFTAAKESNGKCMVIGCDVDQWADGENGDSNIILTSVLKNMAINVERALESIVEGTFQGGNVLLQADTDSTGFVKTEGHHQMAQETISVLDEAYELVKNGTIVPASNPRPG